MYRRVRRDTAFQVARCVSDPDIMRRYRMTVQGEVPFSSSGLSSKEPGKQEVDSQNTVHRDTVWTYNSSDERFRKKLSRIDTRKDHSRVDRQGPWHKS